MITAGNNFLTISSKEYRSKHIKKNKYKNHRVVYNGIKFASIKEKDRYIELKLMEMVGEIKDLMLQVKYELQPKQEGQRAINYISDFQYREKVNCVLYGMPIWQLVIEDCKGYKTPIYKLKKKLMKARYNIDIKET
jgi:hypothetical protein